MVEKKALDWGHKWKNLTCLFQYFFDYMIAIGWVAVVMKQFAANMMIISSLPQLFLVVLISCLCYLCLFVGSHALFFFVFYVASFSGSSIFDWPYGILERLLWFQNLWSPYFIYCLLWYFMKSYILLLYCFLYLLTFIWIIFKRVHCLVYINVNELGYYCWTDILFLFGMFHITNMEDIPFFNGKSAYRSYMNQAVYCTMIIDYFLFWLYLLRI